MSVPVMDPRDVLVTFLTADDLEARGILFEVLGKVSTSDKQDPQAALRSQAAELGANVVLAYERGYLPGYSRGLAARVLDVSSLISTPRRLGAWAILGGFVLAVLAYMADAHDYWGFEYDIGYPVVEIVFWAGLGLMGFGIWLVIKGRLTRGGP